MLEFVEILSNIVLVLAFPVAYLEYKRSDKKHRTDMVMDILGVVGSKEQRQFRKVVYDAAKAGKTRDGLTEKEMEAFEEVSVAFDRIGMYALHDSSFRGVAIDHHYDILIRTWNASSEWVDHHVKDFGGTHYRFYRRLVDEAKQKYPQAKDINAV